LLLCISTAGRLWRPLKGGLPNERRRKAGQSERSRREGHAVQARPMKPFRKAGDRQNAVAGLWMKGNLRGKRRDPWHWANALPKAAADPALSGGDATTESRTNPSRGCEGLQRGPKPGSRCSPYRSAGFVCGRSWRANGRRVRCCGSAGPPCGRRKLRREESQERCRDETGPTRRHGAETAKRVVKP
jgi:hypothetical protein